MTGRVLLFGALSVKFLPASPLRVLISEVFPFAGEGIDVWIEYFPKITNNECLENSPSFFREISIFSPTFLPFLKFMSHHTRVKLLPLQCVVTSSH